MGLRFTGAPHLLCNLRKLSPILAVAVLTLSCDLWEYADPSAPISNRAPETYLTLTAAETLYARIGSVEEKTDPVTGESYLDTAWVYSMDEAPDPDYLWDTLGNAFTTITTSKQNLNWWGEDSDGHVIGYQYKWNVNDGWTFTTKESGLFFLPLKTEMDVFTFEVVAVDNDSLTDSTAARVVIPVRNSAPQIGFRYRSNPLVNDPGDTNFTFPTRTFVWDIEDEDGIETVPDVFYAVDDTCATCWHWLDAALNSSVTVTNLEVGAHTFYAKVRDIAGAQSNTIRFPETDDLTTANHWVVMPVVGATLLVDDFPQDRNNRAQKWYKGILDTLAEDGDYSVWEIGEKLPYSNADINANLNYFDHVIWYTAYTGPETYNGAGANIANFLAKGGNLFLNTAELKDTTLAWFPIDSTFTLNPSGRLLKGTELHAQWDSSLDLSLSKLIAIRVRGFETDTTSAPYLRSLYRLQEPGVTDGWLGTPNVCAVNQFRVNSTTLSGKAVFMTLPLHNGSEPLMEGTGSASKFISYLWREEFRQ